jgi:hypothetical protein
MQVSLPPRSYSQRVQTNQVFLTPPQLWLAAGATVVSLKWAVPQLQEQEACHGFYVYTAAAAASASRPSLARPCTAASGTCPSSTHTSHAIAPAMQSSADDFFYALEVSAAGCKCCLQSGCCGVFGVLHDSREFRMCNLRRSRCKKVIPLISTDFN